MLLKIKSERNKFCTTGGALRSNGKAGQPQKSLSQSSRVDALANGKWSNGNAGMLDTVVCLTNEQLHQILNTAQTSSSEPHLPGNDRSVGR